MISFDVYLFIILKCLTVPSLSFKGSLCVGSYALAVAAWVLFSGNFHHTPDADGSLDVVFSPCPSVVSLMSIILTSCPLF